MTEDDALPDSTSSNAIIAAEGELKNHISDAVILRLAGLYGEDRHPAKYMAGRKDISDGDAPVNLVHSEDVIQATMKVIHQNIKGEIFNICSLNHPAKAEIYTVVAERLDLKKPKFLKGGSDGKVVSTEKIRNTLKLDLIHDDPMDFRSG
jgi:nucleoside-diphosphate-sugar epimerase